MLQRLEEALGGMGGVTVAVTLDPPATPSDAQATGTAAFNALKLYIGTVFTPSLRTDLSGALSMQLGTDTSGYARVNVSVGADVLADEGLRSELAHVFSALFYRHLQRWLLVSIHSGSIVLITKATPLPRGSKICLTCARPSSGSSVSGTLKSSTVPLLVV